MKKSISLILILTLILFLASFTSYKVDQENTSSGKIMAFRPLTLLEGVAPSELERFGREQLTPTFKNEVVGVESYIIKGQRGGNKGQYVHLLVFDNEVTRNFYFPYEHSGETNISEAALQVWRKGQIMLLDSLPKYTKPLSSTEGYTDYVFFE